MSFIQVDEYRSTVLIMQASHIGQNAGQSTAAKQVNTGHFRLFPARKEQSERYTRGEGGGKRGGGAGEEGRKGEGGRGR